MRDENTSYQIKHMLNIQIHFATFYLNNKALKYVSRVWTNNLC